MGRKPNTEPQFDRMIQELQRARDLFRQGQVERAEAILRLVSSIALAESEVRAPGAPIPE